MDQKSKREERRDDTQTQRSSFYLLYFFKIVCGTRVYPVYPVLVEILYTVQYCILDTSTLDN